LRHADYQFTTEGGLKLRLNDLAASLVNGGLESLAAWRRACTIRRSPDTRCSVTALTRR